MRRVSIAGGARQVSELCLDTMTWGEQNAEAEAHAQLERNIAGASLVPGDDVLRAIDAVHVRCPDPSAGL